jgi:branched-chain amino acid transport system ATP-binding protein
VLRDVTFSISAGECVGILGANGAGKTTLLRALIGELTATAGTLSYHGSEAVRWSTTRRARKGIGYVPQGRAIFANLTVQENLRIGCLANPADESMIIEQVLMTFPRLKTYLYRRGGALSGGEQQLLALARCLCAAPRLILLDEPTEGIQPSIREEMIETLSSAASTQGVAILLAEQNLHFLEAVSHRVLHLERGEILTVAEQQL